MTKEQWLAIKTNDKRYDGQFFYALKTTKTVCRPSCPARDCNPKNVIIFEKYEDAIQQGFRPCNRCRPDQMDWTGTKAELAERAKAYIQEHYAEKFSLEVISGALFVNGNYLLRVFKEITGQTLLQFHNTTRCCKAQTLLLHSELSISFISCQVGFPTASHFARVFKTIVGCSPSEYRKQHLREFM